MKLPTMVFGALVAAAGSASAQSFHIEAMNLFQAGDSSVDILIHNGEFPMDLQVFREGPKGMYPSHKITVDDPFVRIDLHGAVAEGEVAQIVSSVKGAAPILLSGRNYRGDANVDGSTNIGDVIVILDHVFSTVNTPLFSPVNADVNGDGSVNIADAIHLLGYLDGEGPAPVRLRTGPELCPDGMKEATCIETLIDAMSDPFERFQADYAYRRLYSIGESAVSDLITNAGSLDPMQPYLGIACYNNNSSLIILGETRAASASLYLVEAIRIGEIAPYLRSEFFDADHKLVGAEVIAKVVDSFRLWDDVNQGVPVEYRPRPTLPGGLGFPGQSPWPGPYIFQGPTHVPAGGLPPGSYCENGGDPVSTDPVREFVWKTFPGPPPLAPVTIYNCYAWASGCRTDAWVVPHGTLGEFVEGLGVDPDTVSPTPHDVPGEVMITFSLCPNGMGSPIHATKRVGDKWSMKNGAGPLIENICDPEAEVEDWYFPEDGKTLIHRYFCPC